MFSEILGGSSETFGTRAQLSIAGFMVTVETTKFKNYLDTVSVDVHRPVLPSLERFTEDHQLLEQEHLTLARLSSLGIGDNQCVLKMGELQFKTREERL